MNSCLNIIFCHAKFVLFSDTSSLKKIRMA